LFLGFGERSVAHQHFAIADADRRCGLVGFQPVCAEEVTALMRSVNCAYS
jgi:hypothetical protein